VDVIRKFCFVWFVNIGWMELQRHQVEKRSQLNGRTDVIMISCRDTIFF
jgi:hypothetical protein